MMTVDTLVLMGIRVTIQYEIHSDLYIDWLVIDAPAKYTSKRDRLVELLNLVLRIHYASYIEGHLRELQHYRQFTDGMNPDPYPEDIPF